MTAPTGGPADEIGAVRRLPFRLSAYYIALFLFLGVNMPFWPLWLSAQGLDAGEIGALLAAALWIRVVANPLIARAADARGETRRPLALMLLLATVAYGAFAFTGGFWAILAVTLVSAAALSVAMPFGDSLTMHVAMSGRVQYGRIRLWGSIAFIVAASGGGLVLAGRDPDLILVSLIVALGLTFLAALLLPDWRRPPMAPGGRGLSALLADRRFLLFLAAASLTQASHSVLNGFATLHWRDAGYDKAVIGALWAEAVIFEVILFAAGAALLRRVDGPRLLVLAAVASVIRWTAFGLSTALPVLVAGQLLHALTFGAAHLAAMDFITRSAPPALAATAQGLYSAVALGAVFGLTMAFSGRLYDALGGGAFFVMAAMAAAGLVVALQVARPAAPDRNPAP